MYLLIRVKHTQVCFSFLILLPSGEKPGRGDWQIWKYLLLKALARVIWGRMLYNQSKQTLPEPRLGSRYSAFFDTSNTGHSLHYFHLISLPTIFLFLTFFVVHCLTLHIQTFFFPKVTDIGLVVLTTSLARLILQSSFSRKRKDFLQGS